MQWQKKNQRERGIRMKLFNEKDTIDAVKKLEADIKAANPGRDISMVYNEEKKPSGYVNFTFTIKSVDKSLRRTGCMNRISMYIFEEKNRVQTFIINSINMKILFYNFTVNSPEIGLYYLKDTLSHGVDWMKLKEKEAAKRSPGKPRNNGGYKKGGFSRKPGYNKPNGGRSFSGRPQKPYNKTPYRKPVTGTSSSNFRDKKGGNGKWPSQDVKKSSMNLS